MKQVIGVGAESGYRGVYEFMLSAFARKMEDVTGSPIANLVAALITDPEYAWGWHCNIAMACYDKGASPHAACNAGAALFLHRLTDGKVDTTSHPAFQQTQEGEALSSPADAPAKPDLSAECKMLSQALSDTRDKLAEAERELAEARKNLEQLPHYDLQLRKERLYHKDTQAKLAAAEEKAKLWETRYTDERNRFHALNGSLMIERQQLAAAENRLALLEWRSAGVKPTREDADAEGHITVMNAFNATWVHKWYEPFNTQQTGWRPFCPPPAPSAEDVSRAEFEAAYIEESLKGQPKGAVFDRGVLARGIDNEYVHFAVLGAFRMWNRGRASKEVK